MVVPKDLRAGIMEAPIDESTTLFRRRDEGTSALLTYISADRDLVSGLRYQAMAKAGSEYVICVFSQQ